MQTNHDQQKIAGKTKRLTILQLMFILSVLGLSYTWILRHFFVS